MDLDKTKRQRKNFHNQFLVNFSTFLIFLLLVLLLCSIQFPKIMNGCGGIHGGTKLYMESDEEKMCIITFL